MDTINDMPDTITENGVRDYAHRIQVRLVEMGEAIASLRGALEPVLNPNADALGTEIGDNRVARAPMVEQLDAICSILTEQTWEVQEIQRRVML